MLLLLLATAHARIQLGDVPQVGRTTHAEDYWKQWLDFQTTHNKYYKNLDEHNSRFRVFMDNVDKINRHNALELSWTMGVTPFADMTAEEFKNHTSCMMPRKTPNPIRTFETSDVADSVDWVAQGKVTPVKNQAQCGSCWAFSTTGCVESRTAIATGQLVSLSEQELVDCSQSDGNQGCNGGLMDDGFKYVMQNHGLCSEADYPYVAKTQRLNCRSGKNKCQSRNDPINSYQDVTSDDEDQLKAAVSEGPVSIAIEADQESFQLYKGGVFSGRCGKRLDHGVLVVGYGTDNGEDFWKVKNSWGDKWGEEGYIRLCRNCHKNGGAGQCGIASQPSFAVVNGVAEV